MTCVTYFRTSMTCSVNNQHLLPPYCWLLMTENVVEVIEVSLKYVIEVPTRTISNTVALCATSDCELKEWLTASNRLWALGFSRTSFFTHHKDKTLHQILPSHLLASCPKTPTLSLLSPNSLPPTMLPGRMRWKPTFESRDSGYWWMAQKLGMPQTRMHRPSGMSRLTRQLESSSKLAL